MASKMPRGEWVRGLPWAVGVGRYDRKQDHWASERSVGYAFLIGDSVQNHPNPHPYQTGSQTLPSLLAIPRKGGASVARRTRAAEPRPYVPNQNPTKGL